MPTEQGEKSDKADLVIDREIYDLILEKNYERAIIIMVKHYEERLLNAVRTFLWSGLFDDDTHQQIAYDVFMKAYNRMPTRLRARGFERPNYLGWLLKAARYDCLRAIRRAKSHKNKMIRPHPDDTENLDKIADYAWSGPFAAGDIECLIEEAVDKIEASGKKKHEDMVRIFRARKMMHPPLTLKQVAIALNMKLATVEKWEKKIMDMVFAEVEKGLATSTNRQMS